MTRRYDEEIEVRLRDGVPEQFLRHGRLYLVREVLARWSGTGAWWRSPAVSGMASGPGPGARGVRATHPADAVTVGLDLVERDFWRVVAGVGRSSSTGVYELCFDCSRGRWVLARTVD